MGNDDFDAVCSRIRNHHTTDTPWMSAYSSGLEFTTNWPKLRDNCDCLAKYVGTTVKTPIPNLRPTESPTPSSPPYPSQAHLRPSYSFSYSRILPSSKSSPSALPTAPSFSSFDLKSPLSAQLASVSLTIRPHILFSSAVDLVRRIIGLQIPFSYAVNPVPRLIPPPTLLLILPLKLRIRLYSIRSPPGGIETTQLPWIITPLLRLSRPKALLGSPNLRLTNARETPLNLSPLVENPLPKHRLSKLKNLVHATLIVSAVVSSSGLHAQEIRAVAQEFGVFVRFFADLESVAALLEDSGDFVAEVFLDVEEEFVP